jgi:hypothetical protein
VSISIEWNTLYNNTPRNNPPLVIQQKSPGLGDNKWSAKKTLKGTIEYLSV